MNIAVQSRLGVLITYHDERSLLTECLTSLMQATDQPDEVWVYDDASKSPATEYIPGALDVKVIRGEAPRGPSHGRNVLLHRCACDYVHFHDADDTFAPEWCSAVRRLIISDKPDIIFTEVALFGDGRLIRNESQDLRALARDGDLLRFCIRNGLCTLVGTYLRQKVKDMGGYDERFCLNEDCDFHVRLASLRPQYRLTFAPLVRRRLRTGSLASDRTGSLRSAARALVGYRNQLPKEYQRDISQKLADIGAALYRLGARREAAEIFTASLEIARPSYEGNHLGYRIIAILMGQRLAEWCVAVLPPGARAMLRRLSPPIF